MRVLWVEVEDEGYGAPRLARWEEVRFWNGGDPSLLPHERWHFGWGLVTCRPVKDHVLMWRAWRANVCVPWACEEWRSALTMGQANTLSGCLGSRKRGSLQMQPRHRTDGGELHPQDRRGGDVNQVSDDRRLRELFRVLLSFQGSCTVQECVVCGGGRGGVGSPKE